MKNSQINLQILWGWTVFCAPAMLFAWNENACTPWLKPRSKKTWCCVSSIFGFFKTEAQVVFTTYTEKNQKRMFWLLLSYQYSDAFWTKEDLIVLPVWYSSILKHGQLFQLFTIILIIFAIKVRSKTVRSNESPLTLSNCWKSRKWSGRPSITNN